MKGVGDPLGWLGGTIGDRLVVERVVGEGGFGIVYRGQHLGFGEPVAIKCLKVPAALGEAEREALLSDFQREARLLHKLSRKTAGIVQALDVGAAVSPRGVWAPFIVMEWLEGASLQDDIVRRSERGGPRRPFEEAVALLTPVAESLAIAHDEGVAHLDVKPANIFLTADGSVKLLDFGIAQALASSDTFTRALARTGTLGAFTPSYAAPEQFNRRHGATGPWTDVFALALVLVEACSSEQALVGETPLELYVAAANEQYRPSLTAFGVRASAEVEDVVRRALEVEPRRRFPDAGAMWSALLRTIDRSVSVAPIPPSLRPASLRRMPGRVSVLPAERSEPAPSPLARTAQAGIEGPVGLNRICTVLFAELSVEASDLVDPELLGEIVERCTVALGGCVEALGGTVQRVAGDSLMAVFGLYEDSATAAERAIHAALRMPAALSDGSLPRMLSRRLPLGVCAGVSTGRVFVRAERATAGFALAATGGPVKLAARLQQSAPRGATLVDRDTYRQVAGLFDVERVEWPAHEARTTGTRCYLVKGPARDRHALHVTAVRDFCGLGTLFVGRAAELETLATVMGAVTSEPCARLVTLLGPPGIGRSRILVELADRLEREGWAVFAAHGSALDMCTGYALAAALFRTRFHIHEDDGPAVAEAKIRRGIQALRRSTVLGGARDPEGIISADLVDPGETDEAVGQLLRVLGVSGAEGQPSTSADEQCSAAKHRIGAAVASLLGTARRPVAIVCDDLHWADEASLSLFEDLCVRLGRAPLLIACAARPELMDRKPLWGEGESAHVRIAVGPLARHQLEEMVRDRLRNVATLRVEVVRRLAEHADGNPLTLVETLHLLVDAGAIDAGDPSCWQLHADKMGELSLPTTVHGIVQARLDRLDLPARMLLARAAVVGRRFWDGVLLALDPEAAAQGGAFLRRLLSELRERGLISACARCTFPDEQEYVFAEGATQTAAYEMLGHKERHELHGRVARWLEARTPSDAGAALVARHLERAAALPEAIAAYRRAGAHAVALGQLPEALHAYDRACRIDDWMSGDAEAGEDTSELFLGWQEPQDGRVASWPSRVGLRMELGDVLRQMGHFDEAEARYYQAERRIVRRERRGTGAIDAAEVPRFEARLAYRLAWLDQLRGKVDEPRTLLAHALERGAEGGLREERAEMLALLSSLLLRAGDLGECRRVCLQALRACRAIAERDDRWRQALSKVLNVLGSSWLRANRLVRAERCFLQASRAVDERRNPDQASRALNNVAMTRHTRGDLEGARSCLQRVLRLVERSGELWVKVTALGNLGEVELALGRHALARQCLLEATSLGEQIRAYLDLPECYRHLARASLAGGEKREALGAARRALELAAQGGGRLYLKDVLLSVAEVCAAIAREHEDASELGREARAVSRLVLGLLDGEQGSAVPADSVTRCRELLGGFEPS